MGWYRPVHAKSVTCKDTRALLVGRKLLQGKLLDVELSIRGILRGYGLKVGEVSRGKFEARIRELTAGHVALEIVIGAMLAARTALWGSGKKLGVKPQGQTWLASIDHRQPPRGPEVPCEPLRETSASDVFCSCGH